MELVLSSESVIEHLLSSCKQNDGYDDRVYTAFIESSVLPKWREWITKRLGDNSFLDRGEYKLRIIEKEYVVHLVSFTRITERFVGIENFSFRWKNNDAIFIDLDGFSRLKEVIREQNLEQFVKEIETWPGRINSQNKTIQIVTFKQNINVDLDSILAYNFKPRNILDQVNNLPDFFVCQAFPWFDPLRLPLLDKQSVNDDFFMGLITFLECQREVCYDIKLEQCKRKVCYDLQCEFPLNVVELCALKLAFCPELDIASPTCDVLAHEIDELIEDSLKRLAKDTSNGYFRDNRFNLIQYANDRDFDLYTQELACFYFNYYFQDWFKFITMPSSFLGEFDHVSINLAREHKFVLSRLSKLSQYQIDGTNFSGMNFELFSGILKTGKVDNFLLDTNYRWLNANEPKCLCENEPKLWTEFEFIGDNQFNFIEDCIECLKFIKFCDEFELSFINPNIKNFVIFKNLRVAKITFRDLMLTSSNLRELIDCKFTGKTRIGFQYCTIEDDVQSWTLLNEFNYDEAKIIEEEKTWQYLFESIINQMKKSGLREFTFSKKIGIKTHNGRIVELDHLKFTIDESESPQLRLTDRRTNETLELYDLKNEVEEGGSEDEDLSSYEFYQ